MIQIRKKLIDKEFTKKQIKCNQNIGLGHSSLRLILNKWKRFLGRTDLSNNYLAFNRGLAEAGISSQQDVKEGVLGPVPHSLRGFLGRHQQLTPATAAFKQCPACSDKVGLTDL